MASQSNRTDKCRIYQEGQLQHFNPNQPFSTVGGYANLYRASHTEDGELALKRPRWGTGDLTDRFTLATREASVWQVLHHPNVLEFLGILYSSPHIYLISPFAFHGSLPQYLETHPDADRPVFISQICSGLAYLHSKDVIHGDVKGANVLVSPMVTAQLCDFGLSKFADTATSTGGKGFSLYWLSPERMDRSNSPRTKESDVYAFGMTIYEILSGHIPFHTLGIDDLIIAVYIQDERPPMTPEYSNSGTPYTVMWMLAEMCWVKQPERRPLMSESCALLEYHRIGWPELPHTEQALRSFCMTQSSQIYSCHIYRDDQLQRFNPNQPFSTVGGYADLYRASHAEDGELALKRPRWGTGDLTDRFDLAAQEASVWQVLRHPNILEFIGILYSSPHIYLISPFASHGTLPQYLQSHPDADRPVFISQISCGLAYVHGKNVIHGDFKGADVLVSPALTAQICDFGFSTFGHTPAKTVRTGVSLPWLSPERMDRSNSPRTKESDVYAFGMTIYEILSGHIPFHTLGINELIIAVCIHDERPPMSPEYSNSGTSYAVMWMLAQMCWAKQPERRPLMSESCAFLQDPRIIRPELLSIEEAPEMEDILQSSASSNLKNISELIAEITSDAINNAERCGGGGFGDVYKLHHPSLGKLALKRVKTHGNQQEIDAQLRRSTREAGTWQQLAHPNVLAFFGVLERSGGVYLISPFIQNGTISDFVKRHPDVDRAQLIRETAAGIAYLHRSGIVHGDIKGANILVAADLRALLCDFGLARPYQIKTSTGMQGMGTIPWQSPELLKGGGKTYKSDVWAFAMTIYEVLSGHTPYYHCISMSAVFFSVLIGRERPPQEPTASRNGDSYALLWEVAGDCWQEEPDERPESQEAHDRLIRATCMDMMDII